MRNAIFSVAVLCAFPVHSRVLDFHSDIRVAKSGELTVTERITVEAGESTPALVRELPHASRMVDVIRNGHPERYALDGTRLRIGGAPLPQGRHLYQITYCNPRHIRFLGAHDELRWSLNGAERVTAEVTLPISVPAREIKTESAGSDSQSFVRDGRAAFRSKEGTTVVVRFPKGVVAEPGLGRRARWLVDDYKGLLLVLGGVGLTAWALIRFKNLSARA